MVVLAADKFRNDRTVRFHAFQGLYLFVAWLIVEWVLSPIFREFHGPIFRVDHLLAGSDSLPVDLHDHQNQPRRALLAADHRGVSGAVGGGTLGAMRGIVGCCFGPGNQ